MAQLLESENASLLGRLASPHCRRLLRHICICSTPTEPNCGLYCNYAEWTLVTVSGGKSGLSSVINSLKKASTFKPSVMTTCDFVLAQPPMAPKGSVYTSSLTCFGSTRGIVFRHFLKGARAKITSRLMNASNRHIFTVSSHTCTVSCFTRTVFP